jgi:hypothetical protein
MTVVATAAVGASALSLLIVAWKSRTVLAGICALGSLATVIVVPNEPLISPLALVIGVALYGLGQLLERLIGAD